PPSGKPRFAGEASSCQAGRRKARKGTEERPVIRAFTPSQGAAAALCSRAKSGTGTRGRLARVGCTTARTADLGLERTGGSHEGMDRLRGQLPQVLLRRDAR